MSTLLILVRRVALAAWRYRWAAAALSWIICGAGWAYVYTIPNQYEASARLYVDADAVLTPLLRGITIDSSLSSQLDVLQRTLLSRPNLEKLISNTDLDLRITGPADLEAMVAELANDIKIVPQTRNLFTITYRNSSPKLAFDVVQTILTTFIESKTGNNRSEMENAQLFLNQQISAYENQLRDAEKKRADFRAKYVDLLPNGDTGVYGLDAAANNLRTLEGQLTDAVSNRDRIGKELASTPALVVTETDATGLPGAPGMPGAPPGVTPSVDQDPRVVAAQRDLDNLLLRDTDSHPDVVAAKKALALAKSTAGTDLAQVQSQRAAMMAAMAKAAEAKGANKDAAAAAAAAGSNSRSLPNPVYEQLKVRMLEAEANVSSLQRQVTNAQHDHDRLEEIARSAPGLQAEYTNLNRDYDVLQSNYKELLGRRELMRIATAAEADADKIKMQVIDPPQVPQNPVAPKRVQLFSAVLAAGLVCGAGLAVLLVQFDQSFHTIDELRDLGLPVAGGISLLNVTVTRGRLASVLAFSMALILLGAIYAGLVYRLMHTPGVV